jgi:hypothetical protein
MCRPWQYQAFVFVDGKFAGTLAPDVMNARTDGSYFTAKSGDADAPLVAEFNRYTDRDPLCCPSRRATVSYRIDTSAAGPLVVPLRVQHQATATP